MVASKMLIASKGIGDDKKYAVVGFPTDPLVVAMRSALGLKENIVSEHHAESAGYHIHARVSVRDLGNNGAPGFFRDDFYVFYAKQRKQFRLKVTILGGYSWVSGRPHRSNFI